MGKAGPEFYDDDAVFSIYMSGRNERVDSPNDVLEKPVIDELVGSLANLRILDLGCGDARYGREALEQGCLSYLGIDGSQNMINLANEQLAGTSGQVLRATIENWTFPQEQFNLVISRLALHYVEDIAAVFANVYNALVEDGRLIFSVEHPVITSCNRARKKGQARQDWIVDGYFDTGLRQTYWIAGEIIKYHRTVEDYFMALRQAGFEVDAVRESRPRPERFTDPATYERRKRIPLMLFFSARKPS